MNFIRYGLHDFFLALVVIKFDPELKTKNITQKLMHHEKDFFPA